MRKRAFSVVDILGMPIPCNIQWLKILGLSDQLVSNDQVNEILDILPSE